MALFQFSIKYETYWLAEKNSGKHQAGFIIDQSFQCLPIT